MLDIKDIIKNKQKYIDDLKQRNVDFSNEINSLELLYKEKNKILSEIENINFQKNKSASLVAEYKQQGKDVSEIIKQISNSSNKLMELKENILSKDEEFNKIILSIPNVPRRTIPKGKSELDNKVVKDSKTINKKSFNPDSHWNLLLKHDMVDFDKGITLAGSKFLVYKNDGAKLLRKLVNIFIDHNVQFGYKEMNVPSIILKDCLITTTQLPKFEEDLYKLDNNFYLSSTGEIQLINLQKNKLLNIKDLPIRTTCFSKCFRKEAGAAGKDTRGILRLHEFHKVEITSICEIENCDSEFDLMIKTVSELLEKLKLPYRIVELCTGDLGFSASKTYDFEVWFPYQNCFREVSSCSTCDSFQSRRGGIRYLDTNKEKHFCGTLNGSSLALDRIIAAIVENNQDEKGNINLDYLWKI